MTIRGSFKCFFFVNAYNYQLDFKLFGVVMEYMQQQQLVISR